MVAAVAAAAAAGSNMRFAIILALISVVGMIFGWWGHETLSGERHFDGEANSIPLFVGITSIAGLLIAVVAYSAAANVMNIFAIFLTLVSIGGMIFGWWGLETPSGQSHYDEMAGIIPWAVGVASIVGLPIAGIIYYFASR